jgi:predicted acylesterase/phospholipase RssA
LSVCESAWHTFHLLDIPTAKDILAGNTRVEAWFRDTIETVPCILETIRRDLYHQQRHGRSIRRALTTTPITPDLTRTLLIVAVNAETGERRAFDRNTGIDLVDAVIATTAFFGWPPALFQGHYYIDGGFYSSDNADLATGFDRVMILTFRSSGPTMSAVSLDAGGGYTMGRRCARTGHTSR